MKGECERIVRELTGKKFVLFVKRGNTAIRLSLKLLKSKGIKDVLSQDQGGWLTYKQFAKKEKLNYEELETDHGVLNPESLRKHTKKALLIHSMPAYAVLMDMKEFSKVCYEQNIFLINDATGSLGKEQAKQGDLIFASFGKWKPVDLGKGGFIATDSYEDIESLEKINPKHDIDFKELHKKLTGLDQRLVHYKKIRDVVLDDLKDYDLIHRNGKGINVIARYYSEKERERLINYCRNADLDYVMCPRKIRVLAKAVSIEIKRK